MEAPLNKECPNCGEVFSYVPNADDEPVVRLGRALADLRRIDGGDAIGIEFVIEVEPEKGNQ